MQDLQVLPVTLVHKVTSVILDQKELTESLDITDQ